MHQHWGRIGNKDIHLFCLRNNIGSRLYVSNFGATAQAWVVRKRDGSETDVLLGYDTLEEYQRDEFYMGSVVGRHANRIGGGRFSVDDKEYRLATREGGYHLHGGEEGFNKKVFDSHYDDASPGTIMFSYTSRDLEEGYPGEFRLEVSYTLDDENCWTIKYRGTTTKTTIINLTQHAYFNLSGVNNGPIDHHSLKISAEHFIPVNELQLPTGELQEVAATPFDFRDFKAITTEMNSAHEQLELSYGYDHSWALETLHTPALKHAATLREPSNNLQLDVSTTEPAIHFYAGNFLDGRKGKSGQRYHKRAGLCLETQHYPDAPNQPAFPSTVLKPGEVFESKTIFRISEPFI